MQRHQFAIYFAAAALLAAPLSTAAAQTEKPKTKGAEKFLGPSCSARITGSGRSCAATA